jgi:ribonuclease HI
MDTRPSARPLTTIALTVVYVRGRYRFHAVNGDRSWSGRFDAPDRDAATAEAVHRIRRDSPQLDRLRVLLKLNPTSSLCRQAAYIEMLPGVSIEVPAAGDGALMKATVIGLAADLLRGPPPELPPIVVAVNASGRSGVPAYGWLADTGDFGLPGLEHDATQVSAELSAVNDAIRRLPYRRLTLVTDSRQVMDTVRRWIVGGDVLPDGRTAESAGLTGAQRRIRLSQYRMNVLPAPGRSGALLHDGADALARLAARFADPDSELTGAEYREQAGGIAEVFSDAFRRQSA